MKKVLITGGAGFIGSNYVRYMLEKYPDYHVVVLDKLTYAGNLANLADIEQNYGERYTFVKGDIADPVAVDKAMQDCQYVLNFAAESHVDRSIEQPGQFIMTDVYGTFVLLEAAKKYAVERFVQISTDEVYGHIPQGSSKEGDRLETRSPYSASKAGGELMAHAYYVTYGVPVLITRGSNNYGPYQYPEKLIPLFITNVIDNIQVPVYGDGQQIRDWIYVLDHCSGIDLVLHKGQLGEAYNVGGGNERTNLEITHKVLELTGKPLDLIKYVKDRPGHDRRYSLDTTKIRQLGWEPQFTFETAMRQTVEWFLKNEEWWRPLKSGEFQEYYQRQYVNR
ncbi:dTDP-glucose 4,6-dehydratase [Candidatus Chlorohelix sp.]|uniref:dTDP-glucose 4,6-dehydratase n=1 Tax=Candidatus Chlorohelix sp. TaxID=3139201 RepID=UPI00306E75E9